MKKLISIILMMNTFLPGAMTSAHAADLPPNCVSTANGLVQGVIDPATGIHMFKGLPFAAPPVGDLRWRPPQPVTNWNGILAADHFGPRAMQLPIYGDMVFRSKGVSEDCLYLNVWTPTNSSRAHLPVLVYFYGGGFQAGDGSELRYDGESMAQQGVVCVTVNYRLGIFGFFAHPELTQESPVHAAGNYGLLDQNAALEWVHENIRAFGGDPKKVTIAGESAGSFSVSAQMASPLSKKLFARAIGESGSILGSFAPVSLSQAEQLGIQFADSIGAKSLADLRAIPAEELLKKAAGPGRPWFPLTIDGYFLPRNPLEIYQAGDQARVPLLVGWNSQESGPQGVLGPNEPTPDHLADAIKKLYGDQADAVLKAYSAQDNETARQVATDLASDRFIAYSTWKWSDLQRKTAHQPVYRYYFQRPRPATVDGQPAATGAVHSAEIEYALGNLSRNQVYAWTGDDRKVSQTLQGYFVNFIKTGNPNGRDLPKWPANSNSTRKPVEVMHIDVQSGAQPESHADRYAVLDALAARTSR